METISEIQKQIAEQHVEDDIPLKSKQRVLRIIAEGIKKNNPLKKGRCANCSREEDKLIPIPMTICLRCSERFIKNSGELHVINKKNGEIICDFCLNKTFSSFYVNPKICGYCLQKVARIHKLGLKYFNQYLKEKQKNNGVK